MTAGLRLQNTLGFFKLFILTSIVIIGMAHLAGVPGFELKGDVEVPDNLRWSKLWEGSGNGATAFVTGLYSVIWWVISLSRRLYSCDADSVGEISGLFRVTVRQIMLSPKSATPYVQSNAPARLLSPSSLPCTCRSTSPTSGRCRRMTSCTAAELLREFGLCHDTCQDLNGYPCVPRALFFRNIFGQGTERVCTFLCLPLLALDMDNGMHRCSAS